EALPVTLSGGRRKFATRILRSRHAARIHHTATRKCRGLAPLSPAPGPAAQPCERPVSRNPRPTSETRDPGMTCILPAALVTCAPYEENRIHAYKTPFKIHRDRVARNFDRSRLERKRRRAERSASTPDTATGHRDCRAGDTGGACAASARSTAASAGSAS